MNATTTAVKSWCSSQASLAKLLAVVYGDLCPPVADAAYLYGEEPQNEEPVIACGEKILAAKTVKQVLFCGGDDQVSMNGNVYSPRKWEERLLKFTESREAVYGIPREAFSHTHVEARQLILYASAHEIKTLYVTAVTPHQIRSFVETVWAIVTGCGGMLLEPPKIKTYSKPPQTHQSWHAPTMIAQTQSGGEKPMIDTIEDELGRIERYYAKGDLVTCEQVLEYLAWRDTN